jgi:NAD+ diphosphatase
LAEDLVFTPLFDPPDGASVAGSALVFSVRGQAVHVREGDAEGADLYLGRLGDTDCWAVDLDGDAEPDVVVTPLLALHASVSEAEWTVAGRAVQLLEWQRTHRYCGRCGVATDDVPGERAKRCPECGLLAFPRLAPAVITLVTRDDGRALLGRNANFPIEMYSCLAGFVEPGETLEQAVAREVREEVGVDVRSITYRRSQPWPFPHSLMIGFRAEWSGGDVVPDGVEIADAAWFSTDDLPMIPPRLSIARHLIDEWIAEN